MRIKKGQGIRRLKVDPVLNIDATCYSSIRLCVTVRTKVKTNRHKLNIKQN